MYGFCNVWLCVCMSYVMCGCVYVCVLLCLGVCMYGLCKVLVCVCIYFLMSGCMYEWVM